MLGNDSFYGKFSYANCNLCIKFPQHLFYLAYSNNKRNIRALRTLYCASSAFCPPSRMTERSLSLLTETSGGAFFRFFFFFFGTAPEYSHEKSPVRFKFVVKCYVNVCSIVFRAFAFGASCQRRNACRRQQKANSSQPLCAMSLLLYP